MSNLENLLATSDECLANCSGQIDEGRFNHSVERIDNLGGQHMFQPEVTHHNHDNLRHIAIQEIDSSCVRLPPSEDRILLHFQSLDPGGRNALHETVIALSSPDAREVGELLIQAADARSSAGHDVLPTLHNSADDAHTISS